MIKKYIAAIVLSFSLASVAFAGTLTLIGVGKPTAAAAWTPASLGANLKAWYKVDTQIFSDAGCTTPATNGSNVSCWQDQSGNGYTVTNTFTNQGVLTNNSYNTVAGIVFTAASGSQLATTTDAVTGISSAAGSVCWTGAFNTASTAGSIGGYAATGQGTGTGANSANFYRLGTPTSADIEFNTNFGTYATITPGNGTHRRFCVVYNGSTVQQYLNGSASTSASLSALTFTSPGTIFAVVSGGGSTGFDGVMVEFFFTNNAMSSGDVSSYETYSVAKWGS